MLTGWPRPTEVTAGLTRPRRAVTFIPTVPAMALELTAGTHEFAVAGPVYNVAYYIQEQIVGVFNHNSGICFLMSP